ncbi:FAD-binding domain-containing protein [Siphonobacter sp.]|uniref:FAD-binding domain-containing protein n=1 Tax=Siphonobacter sp. TaxID=1869184 RepID=UPI003B3A3928
MNILWFQRDLRCSDHLPLQAALAEGQAVVLVFCYEPLLLKDPHFDKRHGRFIRESLQDLTAAFQRQHHTLHIIRNDFLAVLQRLHRRYGVETIFSYEETGLPVLHQRNKAIEDYCQSEGVEWVRFPKVSGADLHQSEGKRRWQQAMRKPIPTLDLSQLKTVSLGAGFTEHLSAVDDLHPFHIRDFHFQRGGFTQAQEWLTSFVKIRAVQYARAEDNPYLSRYNASRLSAYLAWGNLSIREVYQAASEAMEEGFHVEALKLFQQKLWLHDRLQARLYEPTLLEPQEQENDQFDAWKKGCTGLPLVDAAMRCFLETGYLIPRLRELLLSVLRQRLPEYEATGWQWLARQSLDFDPMLLDAYQKASGKKKFLNPVKESRTLPDVIHYLRIWLPELAQVPPRFLHEPWRMRLADQRKYGVDLGRSYPMPPKSWIPRTVRKRRVVSARS